MRTSKKAASQAGFTFPELVVTCAMMAVLTALSIPAYQRHVLRGNRALAQTTLIDLASKQEKYALQHDAYATDLDTLLGSQHSGARSFFLSRDGRKSKTLNGDGGSIYEIELLDASSTSFNLKAVAVDVQAKDRQCQSLTLDSKGRRTATALSKEDSTICWR